MRKNKGFMLIEFVVLIIVIAVLAAFIVPRYIPIDSTAKQNATNSIAASLSTVSATNFSKRTANSSQGSAITNCTDIGPLLQGGLPSGYSISSQSIANGVTQNCTLNGPGSTTATFVGMGIT